MSEIEVGVVRHFFDKASVAAVDITGEGLAVGDTVHIKGHTTDVTVMIDSMQIDRQPVAKAGVGDSIGIRIPQKAREQDKVYKVVP